MQVHTLTKVTVDRPWWKLERRSGPQNRFKCTVPYLTLPKAGALKGHIPEHVHGVFTLT
jgi:hypothetical protein